MAPEQARVFIIEADPTTARIEELYLNRCGHHVVGQANTLHDAVEATTALKAQEIDVVVIDDNFTSPTNTATHQTKLTKLARQHAPDVKIIGFTHEYFGLPGADVNVKKDAGFKKLADTVTNI